MPLTVGADGTVTVPIDADADPAAKEIEDAFSDAITRAMKDPAIRAAVTGLVKGVLTEVNKIPKSTGKAWNDSVKQAQRATKTMSDGFKRLGEAATKATKIPSSTNASYNSLTQQIAAMANNMEKLAQATRVQRDLLVDLGRSARAATRSQNQENRDAILAADRLTRERIGLQQRESNQLRASSTQRVAILNAFSKQALQIERSLTRVFELTWKSAERAVRAFARGASAALQGIAKVASTVFSAISRSIAAFTRGAAHAFTGLGRGVGTALGGVSRAIQSALRRDENAYRTSFRNREHLQAQSLGRQAAAQQRFQTQQRSGILGGLGGGGLLAGAAGGAGILSLLTSGFERAGQQELLQLTFTTLLQDGPRATAILQEISDFARTTSFDFVEVASSVAQFTATLGDVGAAFDITKFLADVVSLTGGTTEALGRVRLAMTQIASAGRLDAANLKQLTESLPGVPFAQILADKFFGGDVAAFSAARDAGELGATITAEAFFDAFQEGVAERFPEVEGFAQVAATTLTGLAQNLKENFAIFGATIITLVEGPLKRFIGGVTDALAVAGAFVSGTMFQGDRGTNPFAAQAASDPNALIDVSQLPAAAQAVFAEQFPDVPQVSAADAAEIWEKFTPPPEVNERLKELRDTLGDIAKTIGGVLGIASGFKILKLALIALTSPLALLVLGSSALGFLFNRIEASSLKFRGALAGLKAAFGGLTEAVGGLLEFVGGLVGSALFGNTNFFKGLGNAIAGFLNVIRRGLRALTDWVKMFEFFLRIGEGGRFLVFTLKQIGTAVGNLAEDLVTNLFGIDPLEAFVAEAEGGNDVLNLLERTFLGPVVRFFRGPFLDGIKGLGGLFGDIVDIIFGGGDEKALAGEGQGSRILDRLQETFIGPIIGFFRGPFADLVEGIGGGIADFGGFLGDIFNAIFGDDAGGVGTRILDVLENTFLGPVVRFFRGPFADGVEAAASFAVDAFRSIVDAIQGFLTLVEPLTDAIGNFFKNLFSSDDQQGKFTFSGEDGTGGLSGIWQGLTDSLGDIGSKIGTLLDPVWTAIKDWFSDTFSVAKVIGVAKDVGNIIREVGRVLGLLASQPEFIIGLALLAVTLLAAISEVLIGVFQGVIENAPEWGALLVSGLSAAFEFIKTDGPGLLRDALTAVVTDPSIGFAIGFGALLLGTGLGRNLLGGVIGFFRNRTETGKLRTAVTQGVANAGIGGAINTGLAQTKTTISVRFLDQMKTLGKSIGAALVGGILAFEAGNVGGRSGSLGGVLLGILTGGATGALIGSTIAPGIGTAIGAVLGTAVAGLGALFGSQAREAENAAAQVDLYVQALQDLSAVDLPTGIADTIREELAAAGTGAFADWGDALVNMADFDFVAFGERLTEGISTPADEATRFLLGLADEAAALDDVGLSGQQFADFIALVNDLGLSLGDLQTGGTTPDLVRKLGLDQSQIDLLARGVELLDILGITEGDLSNIHGVLTGTSDAVTKALGQIALNAELAGDEVKTFLGSGGGDALSGALSNVQVPIDDLKEAAHDAQSALEELLNVNSYGGSFQALQDQLALDLPDLNELILRGLEGVAPENRDAAIRQIVGPFADDFAGLLSQAVEEGVVTNGAELDTFVEGLRQQVLGLNLGPEATLILLQAINALDTPETNALIKEKSQAVMETVARETAEAATGQEGKFNGVGETVVTGITTGAQGFASGAGAVALSQTGLTIAESIAAGITSSKSIASAIGAQLAGTFTSKPTTTTARPPTTGVTVDDSGVADARKLVASINAVLIAGTVRAARAGQAIGQAITSGIASGGRLAAATAAALAFAAAGAASRFAGAAFIAGQNIGQGLAAGIASMATHVANTAILIAAAAVNAARKVLGIHSPSRAFRDIGREIGRGFIQGIKDSEGDMAAAIGTAIENAVTAGAERAGQAIRRAQVGSAIFQALQPSPLPGGTTSLELLQQRAAITQSTRGFGATLHENAGGLFGESGKVALFQATIAAQGVFKEFAQGLRDVRGEVAEAQSQQTALAKFDADRARLDVLRANGSLGNARYQRELKDLNEQLSTTAITQAEYTEKLKVLNNELAVGKLSTDEFAARLKDLGSRPDRLSARQLDLLRSGGTSLNAGTLAGQANIGTISEALDQIRSFGQTALEQGVPLNTVIAQMREYANAIRNQAIQLGFNGAQLDDIIDTYGLSADALRELRASLTDLNINTIAGAANTEKINEQLQAIRDYGAALIGAGATTTDVIFQVRKLRGELIAQATAFGFNAAQIANLVNAAGLSESALTDLILQLQDFDRTAHDAARVAAEAAQAARDKAAAEAGAGPGGSNVDRPIEVNVYPPFGDPEAIGLGVVNQLSYNLLVNA